jgi:hypothetical protein
MATASALKVPLGASALFALLARIPTVTAVGAIRSSATRDDAGCE